MKQFYKIKSVVNKVFGDNIELLPSVNELFELELANLEFNCLPKDQLLERTAYIKSINNQFSKHYTLYSEIPETLHEDRSALTKSYFEDGLFSTGYATHGLFPYRGKFHPQMIKSLINIIGIKKGDIILDPFCGSGTLNIEAALMGIDSYAIDISPFCQFMTRTKYESLKIERNTLLLHTKNTKNLFELFSEKGIIQQMNRMFVEEELRVYCLALLAFLDSMGYAKRVEKSSHKELFEKVLKRYKETILNFISNPCYNSKDFGLVSVLKKSEALKIDLKDKSIDAVITSPPYSFAIDYVENDKDQLEYMGYDIKELKNKMIGLKGKNKTLRLENYFTDMDIFCSEVARVLKKGKYFILIIGSNTNQTGGIRLEQSIINSAKKYNMPLVKNILKPIRGMRNTMKDEYVLIFEKQ